ALRLRHLSSFPTRRSSDLPGNEARARRFAVTAGHDDAIAIARDVRQHIGEGEDRLAAGEGGGDFRIFLRQFGMLPDHDREACQTDRKSTRLNSSHSQISYA